MEFVFLILWIICSIVVFVTYHKIFDVVYFDVGSGCLKEIIICSILGAILAAILNFLFKAILNILLVILAIIVGIAILVFLVKFVMKLVRKSDNNQN